MHKKSGQYNPKRNHFKSQFLSSFCEEIDKTILYKNELWTPYASDLVKQCGLNKQLSAHEIIRNLYAQMMSQILNKPKSIYPAYHAYTCLVARHFLIEKKLDENYIETLATQLDIEPIKFII